MLVCLSLAFWSVAPIASHVPNVIGTIQDHLEMIEDHGHSHGFEEDLFWAMHGHSHDVADHDHNQAFLVPSQRLGPPADFAQTWLGMVSVDGPSRQFRIERPPRV